MVFKTENRTRVGLLAPSIHYGGAERWMLNLAKFCDPARIIWTICVITRSWYDQQMLDAMAALMPVYHENILYEKEIVNTYNLNSAVHDLLSKSDVVLTWEFDHEMFELTDTDHTKIIIVAHRENITLSEFITFKHFLAAVSNACSASFGCGMQKRVKVIENGIDLNRCFPLQSRKTIRDLWKCDNNDLVIGYIGRMDPAKNCVALARAVRGLGMRSKGVFYGTDVFEVERIRAQMRELAGDRVLHFNPTEDIGSVLHAIDVFFLPSYTEGFSMSLLEAWAAGVPVVATRVGVIPELETKYGQLVIPVEPDDPDDVLAIAIQKALKYSETKKMRARAQEMVFRNFNASLMAEKWTEYILTIVNRS